MISLTPDQSRKVGGLAPPSPSPFLTPRPERRRPDSRGGSEWNSNRHDKEVNVQVLVRCRPLNEDEQKSNVSRVISCNESKREITVTQNIANKQVEKLFTFDKVFGPKSQQRSIYDQAISPIVNEALEGYNCTVFAYGQTGTGKTYTMEGGMRNKVGELSSEAGVIPRAIKQIFETLEAQKADYSIKVTFLELYNEEITDLLASEDSKNTEEKIKLMEDGKGCVIVRGLEEEIVYSANEIFDLLERGALRRRTADTLLNKRSSRSHSVFSITVHMKESSVGDVELIKCGKLNLVDLAGSENISRSGAREGRAREAGEINKSLLTLGRVINALVEHSLHIPYRDSKLTRLLRDSLGGKTKTCIIATISPSNYCLEETLSTLDYACRAKNIRNKPEANQKLSKAVLLKDLYLELERMKQDVKAAREKNGVYISNERFILDEAEKKAKNEKIEQLEAELNISKKQADEYRELYLCEQEQKLDVEAELKVCKVNLEKTEKTLQELQESYRIALATIKDKENLISKLQHSENSLVERAKELRGNLVNASEDINALFTRLDQKDKLEEKNQSIVLTFDSNLNSTLKQLQNLILGSMSDQKLQLRNIEQNLASFHTTKSDVSFEMEKKIKKMSDTFSMGLMTLKKLVGTLKIQSLSDLDEVKLMTFSQANLVENFLETACVEAKNVIFDIKNCFDEQKLLLDFSSKQHEEELHKRMVLSEAISNATVNYLTALHQHAFEVMNAIEQSKVQKIQQLQEFENNFKEEAIKDEKIAMEIVSEILKNLTAKRTAMVSEASVNFKDNTLQESKILIQDLSNIQKVSILAKEEVHGYVENVKKSFVEETFGLVETRNFMENNLQDCTSKLNQCDQQWSDLKLGVNNLSKNGLEEIESIVLEKNIASHVVHEKLVSDFSSLSVECEGQSEDLLICVNGSLMLDTETKKEIDSISKNSLNQLNITQKDHHECVSNIRNTADQCLKKDYSVDQYKDMTPKKRVFSIPSLESIDELKTPLHNTENKPKHKDFESKLIQPLIRAPFADMN